MPGRRQRGEGSLYPRGKQGGRGGQWVAVADLGWKNGKRDRREFTGKTPDEAREKRQQFLDRRRDGFTIPKGRQPYVSEWLLHWLHNVARPRIEETTWERSYRQKVEDLIAPYFDRITLPELAIEHVEAWHATLGRVKSKRTGRPLSASTVTTAHRILSSAMNDAVRRKRIQANPVALIPPPQAD